MANIVDTEPLGHAIIMNLTLSIPLGFGLFLGLKSAFAEWSKVKMAEIDLHSRKIDALFITNMEKCFNDLHEKKNLHHLYELKEEIAAIKKDFRDEISKIRQDLGTYKEDLLKMFREFK